MTLSHQADQCSDPHSAKKNSTISSGAILIRMVCGSVVKRAHQWSQNSYFMFTTMIKVVAKCQQKGDLYQQGVFTYKL